MMIFDEYGRRWYVLPGDPAAKAAKRLQQLGFRQIVLPRSMIAGDTAAPTVAALQRLRLRNLADTYRDLAGKTTDEELLRSLACAFLADAVLYDCVKEV